MTEPHHDGDPTLEKLYTALADSRANTQRLEELIAEYEQGLPPEAVVHQRRRGLYIVPGVAAAGFLSRRLIAHPVGAAVASSAATAALVAGAFLITGPDRHTDDTPTGRPPAVSAPTGAPRTTVTVTSPETHPQGPPPEFAQAPEPAPSGERPSGAPSSTAPASGATGHPTSSGPAATSSRSCRIVFPHLPILRQGLLCTPPRL